MHNNECSFELRIGGKVCTFLSLYRPPSENRDKFETFLDNLQLNFDHTSHKNPCIYLWYTNDSTDTERSKIVILMPIVLVLTKS